MSKVGVLRATAPQFDAELDRRFAHGDPGLDDVLHVFDAHWHGIRSACGCLPGHKLAVSHRDSLTSTDMRYIFGQIYNWGITRLVFHGYSNLAGELAFLLHQEFGARLELRVVTHVTSSQFEHLFELEMLRLIRHQLDDGILVGAGSVKPGFGKAVPFVSPVTLINLFPAVAPVGPKPPADGFEIFVPLENTFRKNLFTNILAALDARDVRRVLCVNRPTGLEGLRDTSRVRVIPFQTREGMLELASRVDLVMNATFAECQPMTQLEALAVGTPCLTGPLEIDELRDMPLTRLCTVGTLDRPDVLADCADRILDLRASDPVALDRMIADYRKVVRAAAIQSYAAFLG